MSQHRSGVFFFCMEPGLHHVAAPVFEEVLRRYEPENTSVTIDGFPVLRGQDAWGNSLLFVRQKNLISYDFARYLPLLLEHFGSADMAVEVNWHAGTNAPDRILTVHSLGDVTRGIFCPAAPAYMRNLLHALEEERLSRELENYTVTTEATHWSGSVQGQNPDDLLSFPVPMVDMEIGSTPECWEHPEAVRALAGAIGEVFRPSPILHNLLCLGGVHVEPSFAGAALEKSVPLGITHILPNQWLVAGEYEQPSGREKMLRAAESIPSGISALVYHNGIKGPYRDQCRKLGEELGIPVLKHRALRKPEELPLEK
ncbi:MAG TPA: D-aminoacyl-tRNA deacylase [Synergistaceae bacterium]|nr:D-aminoacyl-tRNA deacylase [Synergistaceae bacterium]HPJ25581.1 D-aminoacyl-tRNA deacylase [Synergistaceae bacterium]HPQ37792.1 D-aminoacyl-tRNA deacylase [Synergistaceae bacterium]